MPFNEFKALESLLGEVWRHAIPAKETTLFALGGRGYYENPASDLLAFFLRPDAEHGLGSLFLSTFLELIGVDQRHLNMRSSVEVECRVRTEDGSEIDLQILGQDWCLLIENKIRHWDANPFESYEAHAKRRRKKPIFCILSPDGHTRNAWIGISYKAYCRALRERMGSAFFMSPLSKWHLFAREFILHMENELYNPVMTTETAAFVEKHADQIAEVQKLAAEYPEFIRQELQRCLEESGLDKKFVVEAERWRGHSLVFRCKSAQWSNNDMVLYKREGAGQRFFISAMLEDMTEPRLSNTQHALEEMPYSIEDSYPCWTSPKGYESSGEAITELCKLARIVNPIWCDKRRFTVPG